MYIALLKEVCNRFIATFIEPNDVLRIVNINALCRPSWKYCKEVIYVRIDAGRMLQQLAPPHQ